MKKGLDELRKPSHAAAINAASFPSTEADLVIWGRTHQYGSGVVVQLFLTVTPIIKDREIRPELWTINASRHAGDPYRIELDIPGRFYEFEPLILDQDDVIQFEKPEGLPLYRSRKGSKKIGFLGKLVHFLEIHEDAIKVQIT